ncbi:hypothetical protein ETD83_01020 [Actinomadura soli]|uniref:Lysine-specific metallo-endopeptidase domain-containing protein n=1 Tax=Actinomadura soli TaxID=2508997 RepID=A0A5C4JJX1_9ACTN|nr:hypothetical protein [Actinomadura soli]TMR07359.1 hypothetical protein ETD83_01020 [Actinomadura soli]
MSSTARIDGALRTPLLGPDVTTVFSGGWSAAYDWVADRVVAAGAPRRIPFPAPFDRDLAGALPGQGDFSAFHYVFKDDKYLRLRASDGLPDAAPADTAPNWDLPPGWTSVDAVFAGGGAKSRFAYFFRRDEYSRFDWTTNARSPNYPKLFTPNWHATGPFTAGIDGEIPGLRSFGTKAYLFRIARTVVDDDGHPIAAGLGRTVSAPIYARYDYDSETFEFTITDPFEVVAQWPGLLPILDAGAATDVALDWVDRTLAALGGPVTPAIATACRHHFAMTGTIDTTVIRARLGEIRTRLNDIPNAFRWTPGLRFAAQTSQGSFTEVGDIFSTFHGPSGRAAALIHEAVHFTFGAGPDVPEWSGATIAGVSHGIATDPGTGASLGAYADLTTAAALTNPSSYAAFAQEVANGEDTRFGAGRPQE